MVSIRARHRVSVLAILLAADGVLVSLSLLSALMATLASGSFDGSFKIVLICLYILTFFTTLVLGVGYLWRNIRSNPGAQAALDSLIQTDLKQLAFSLAEFAGGNLTAQVKVVSPSMDEIPAMQNHRNAELYRRTWDLVTEMAVVTKYNYRDYWDPNHGAVLSKNDHGKLR